MTLINRDEAIAILDKLIKARCDCSKQKITEKLAFEYCKTILMKLPAYDQDIQREAVAKTP